MNKITEDMKVYEILDNYPKLEKILLQHGLYCSGCPGSNTETIHEAAQGHGVEPNKLLKKLNEALEQD